MPNDIEELAEQFEAEIDEKVADLSREEYRDFLEEILCLVQSRLAAVKRRNWQ